ncbi:hypothetical protein D3C77_808070 [compost metagenome]
MAWRERKGMSELPTPCSRRVSWKPTACLNCTRCSTRRWRTWFWVMPRQSMPRVSAITLKRAGSAL